MTEVAPDAAAPRKSSTMMLTSMTFRVGTIALNAVTGIVTARALSPEGRGELASMIIWPMLFAGLTTFGLPSALVYHLRREHRDEPALVGWALLLSLGGSIVGTAVGWWLIPLWLAHHPPEVIRASQWCLLTTALCSLTLTGRAAWEARGYFTWSTLSQLVTPLVVVFGLGLLIALDALKPTTAAAVYVLAGLPSLLWILTSLAMVSRPSLAGGRAVWGRLSHYGVRSYGVDLCGILAIYLDQAIVVGLLSASSMGIYAVALSLSRVIGAVHATVAMVVFPKAVGLAPDAIVEAIGRSARIGTLVAAGAGLAVLFAGPTLLLWLYGAPYAPAVHILPILVVEAIAAGLAQVLLQGFLAAGRPGIATMVLALGLAGSVPLFLVLVPAFGVTGASLALLGGSTLRVLLTLGSYRWVLKRRMPSVRIGGDDFAELARYGSGVVSSVTRLGAAGEVK